MSLGDRFPDILVSARAGGAAAWTELYRDLAPAVLGYLRSQGAREAEDLVGDVFVQVVRGLSRFEGDEGGFRSWVFVIAHNRLRDEHRHLARHPVDAAPTEDLDRASGVTVESDVLASLDVRRAIDRLSPDQREVVILRFLGDLSIEGVAEVVGKRPGAVKALQHRALAALKKMLAETVSL